MTGICVGGGLGNFDVWCSSCGPSFAVSVRRDLRVRAQLSLLSRTQHPNTENFLILFQIRVKVIALIFGFSIISPLEKNTSFLSLPHSNFWAFVRKLYVSAQILDIVASAYFLCSNFQTSLPSGHACFRNNLLFILSSACLFLSNSAIRIHQTSKRLMRRQVCAR